MNDIDKELYRIWLASKQKAEKLYKPEFEDAQKKREKTNEIQRKSYHKSKEEHGEAFLEKRREATRKAYQKKQEQLKIQAEEDEKYVKSIVAKAEKKVGRPKKTIKKTSPAPTEDCSTCEGFSETETESSDYTIPEPPRTVQSQFNKRFFC
jgi:hypothetical protein